jgi:sortase A
MKHLFGLLLSAVLFVGCGGGRGLVEKTTPQALPKQQSKPTTAPIVGEPLRLLMPVLALESEVEKVGLTKELRMGVPSDWWNVGWYELGVKPGEKGNAVLAGHLDSPTGPAVFANLFRLTYGDRIHIIDEWGKQLSFEVVGKAVYTDENFPIDLVFGNSEERLLNLITCQGVFDSATNNYSERLVVTAVFIP